ncbi:MAG TPA: hypothetical protein VG474_01380 [Solirubrobacteraceae bacterium]|nr:hypothetical protein [Solirubrobacteraceae bacterium]
MIAGLERIREIHIGSPHYAAMLAHARRKLLGDHLPGETPERKAFGLVVGRIDADRAETTDVVPLLRNLRHEGPYRAQIDALVRALAVPSETPPERRGWYADPKELLAAQRACDLAGTVIFGSYHVHRVGWPEDPRRETCTALDEALARGRGLWMLVLSMVDPDRPVLRAFFEGDNEREARVVLGDGRPPRDRAPAHATSAGG